MSGMDPVTGEISKRGVEEAESLFERWDDRSEIVEELESIREVYNNYLCTANNLPNSEFASEEAVIHKEDAIKAVSEFASNGGAPSVDILQEKLEIAYNTMEEFTNASPDTRDRYEEHNSEAHRAMVRAAYSPVSLKKPLMEGFKEGNNMYRITVGMAREGDEILDSWVESAEEIHSELERKQKPATTPEDREESAGRSYY